MEKIKDSFSKRPDIEVIDIRIHNDINKAFVLCVMDDEVDPEHISITLKGIFEKELYKSVSVFSSTCAGLSDALKLVDSIAEQNIRIKQSSDKSLHIL